MTDSMRTAMDETDRRRAIQQAYNEEHDITPQTIIRALDMQLAGIVAADYTDLADLTEGIPELASQQELDDYIVRLESDMPHVAKQFEIEQAAKFPDTIRDLPTKQFFLS